VVWRKLDILLHNLLNRDIFFSCEVRLWWMDVDGSTFFSSYSLASLSDIIKFGSVRIFIYLYIYIYLLCSSERRKSYTPIYTPVFPTLKLFWRRQNEFLFCQSIIWSVIESYLLVMPMIAALTDRTSRELLPRANSLCLQSKHFLCTLSTSHIII